MVSNRVAERILNSSAERFCVLPALIVPMLSLPGSARRRVSSAAMSRSGELAATTTAIGKTPIVTIGAKSVDGLKGSVRNRLALIAVPLLATSSV